VKGVDLVQQRISQQIGGEPAVTVEYRSGGNNRFGTVTYLTHADNLWTFSWMGGGWCEVEGGIVFEGDAYSRMQSSFKFTD
jgi:hypothetical protein